MQMPLIVLCLVLAIASLGLAAKVYSRVKFNFDIDVEDEQRRLALTERWRGYVAKAVELDPTKSPTVAPGTLVIVRGRLEGEGTLTDDVFGIARPGALSLQRRGWIAEIERSTTTETYWDPVRRPSDGIAPGHKNWMGGGGKTRTRTNTSSRLRWMDVYPGSPRDKEMAVRMKDAIYTESARIDSIPVSPPMFRGVERKQTVQLGAAMIEKLPAVFHGTASVLNDDGYHGLEIHAGRPESQRIALLEAPAGDYTILAGFDGKQIVAWRDPASDEVVAELVPGRVANETFIPPFEPRLSPGETPIRRLLNDNDPTRALIVFGGGLAFLVFAGLALRGMLSAGR